MLEPVDIMEATELSARMVKERDLRRGSPPFKKQSFIWEVWRVSGSGRGNDDTIIDWWDSRGVLIAAREG